MKGPRVALLAFVEYIYIEQKHMHAYVRTYKSLGKLFLMTFESEWA